MATIRTNIVVQDGMSRAFRSMTVALNTTLSSFEALQRASSNAIDTSSIETARRELASAEIEINRIEESLRSSQKQQENFNRSVRSGGSAMDGLVGKVKTLVGAYLGVQAIGKGVEAVDTNASQQARLSLIVDENNKLQETLELQNKIYEAAQRSRGAYNDMVDVTAKLGLLAGDAFTNNDELVAFNEIMQKSFKISGASTSEASNAMYQLTQAMASGRLQGDEFRSIIENAPMLADAIADYCGVSRGELKELSSDGAISADIIKAAVFNMADDVESKFAEMPMTFSDAWTMIKNSATNQARGMMQNINGILNSDTGKTLINGISGAIGGLINAFSSVFGLLANVASFAISNWSTIEPVLWGVGAALLTYNGYLAITKALEECSLASKAATVALTIAQGTAMGFLGLMTGNMAMAQAGLNMVLNACPLLLICTLIALVIAWIANWIKSVGGIKIAWMIVSNYLLNTWDNLKLAFFTFTTWCTNSFQTMAVALSNVCANICIFFNNMKQTVLNIIQGMVNGAIDLINSLINAVNNIPGVAIDTIQHVTFATEEQAYTDAKNKILKENQAAAEKSLAEDVARRNKELDNLSNIYKMQANKREFELNKARYQQSLEGNKSNITDYSNMSPDYSNIYDGSQLANIGEGVGDTAKNTGRTADKLEATEEDLKYLRDLAEQEVIDRTVFRDIKVELGGVTNNVNSNMDLDGIVDYIGNALEEAMISSAEGAH